MPASIANIQSVSIPYIKDDAQVITYDNGHTLVYVPKKGNVFNLSTWVKTGSIHEDDVNNGVSHFLEHLMFKGTDRMKPGEFDRIMESMGAIINAATWKDFTFYYVTGPQGKDDITGDNFTTALDLHADMLLFSTLPDSEIGPTYNPHDPNYQGEKRERSVVIEEIGMREDMPITKIFNALNHMMYQDGHPYQRDVIGTRDIIGAIPRQSIEEYYQRWYSAPNMTTIVVGEFDFDTLKAEIPKYFAFDRRSVKVAPGQAGSYPNIHVNGKHQAEVPGQYETTFFMMGYHGPKSEDLRSMIALDVASYVLGESRSSRLTQALLEKAKTPNFNSINCGQSGFKLGSTFYVQGNFLSSDVEESIGQVKGEIHKFLAEEPMTQEELERAVKKLKVDFAETSETAAGIAETIGESITVYGSLDYYTQYLSLLETMDLSTVQTVAKKYLDPANAYTSVLVPTHA